MTIGELISQLEIIAVEVGDNIVVEDLLIEPFDKYVNYDKINNKQISIVCDVTNIDPSDLSDDDSWI